MYDDRALEKILRERGLKGLVLVDSKREKFCRDEELVSLISNMANYYRSFDNPIISTIPSVVIRGLIRADAKPEQFESVEELSKIVSMLEGYFSRHNVSYKLKIKEQEDKSRNALIIYHEEGADPAVITAPFLNSIEYNRIKNSYPHIRDFLLEEEKDLRLIIDDKAEVPVKSFEDIKQNH